MNYLDYRKTINEMWKFVKSDEFNSPDDITEGESQGVMTCSCGMCNPEFGPLAVRPLEFICPFDMRSDKNMTDAPCADNCHVFIKDLPPHKLKIMMAKFMTRLITKEAIESIKSLAKACRGAKGVSKFAAQHHIKIADKVIRSTKNFGGYEFLIDEGKISATKRENI